MSLTAVYSIYVGELYDAEGAEAEGTPDPRFCAACGHPAGPAILTDTGALCLRCAGEWDPDPGAPTPAPLMTYLLYRTFAHSLTARLAPVLDEVPVPQAGVEA